MAYLQNKLTLVWAILVAITIAAWGVGGGQPEKLQADFVITAGVLLIAAIKAQLVIMYFMEVKASPQWLKRTAYGWVAGLFLLLLISYWVLHR